MAFVGWGHLAAGGLGSVALSTSALKPDLRVVLVTQQWPFTIQLHNLWLMQIMTCIALGVHFVLEQPLTSVLPDFEAVRTALTEAQAKSIVIPLWKFGASSHKPLILWGTAPWLTQLSNVAEKISATQASSSQLANDQSRPGQIHVPGPTCTLAIVGENGQVTGIRADMAASSSYPACFCDVVAFLHNAHLKSLASKRAAMEVVSILGRRHPELRKQWFVEGLLVFL
jgi:hypothetical protein